MTLLYFFHGQVGEFVFTQKNASPPLTIAGQGRKVDTPDWIIPDQVKGKYLNRGFIKKMTPPWRRHADNDK